MVFILNLLCMWFTIVNRLNLESKCTVLGWNDIKSLNWCQPTRDCFILFNKLFVRCNGILLIYFYKIIDEMLHGIITPENYCAAKEKGSSICFPSTSAYGN